MKGNKVLDGSKWKIRTKSITKRVAYSRISFCGMLRLAGLTYATLVLQACGFFGGADATATPTVDLFATQQANLATAYFLEEHPENVATQNAAVQTLSAVTELAQVEVRSLQATQSAHCRPLVQMLRKDDFAAIAPGTSLRACDLSGMNLFGLDFSGVDLYATRFDGADLSGAQLQDADLRYASLRNANLRGADLTGSRLEWAALHNARLDDATKIEERWRLAWNLVTDGGAGADLQGTDLSSMNLSGADFSSANLIGVDFVLSDLSGADFRYADLSGADVQGADLSNVDLRWSRLEAVEFNYTTDLDKKWRRVIRLLSGSHEGKDLRYVDLSDTDLVGAQLADYDMTGANLSGSILDLADLGNVNLQGALLNATQARYASFSEAVLVGASLRGADLTGADLSFSDLSNAVFDNLELALASLAGAIVSEDQLDAASSLSGAQLPDGSISDVED